jgi:hypothetical protein
MQIEHFEKKLRYFYSLQTFFGGQIESETRSAAPIFYQNWNTLTWETKEQTVAQVLNSFKPENFEAAMCGFRYAQSIGYTRKLPVRETTDIKTITREMFFWTSFIVQNLEQISKFANNQAISEKIDKL